MEIKKAFDNINPINYIFEKIRDTLDFQKHRYSAFMNLEKRQEANKTKDIWENLRRKVTNTQQS